MKEVTKRIDQEELIDFIKCLLGAPKEFQFQSATGKILIKIHKADSYRVQKAIYDWLSAPQRKDDMYLRYLGDKGIIPHPADT